MRKTLIAGNWKMHKTLTESIALVEGLKPLVHDVEDVEIVVGPPFTSLSMVHKSIQSSNIYLAAQNLFYEKEGAYTGEISGPMIKDMGCRYVILGHSERREYFGETDEIVNKKIHAALAADLSVIFCLGESLDERENNKTFDVVERQNRAGLKDCGAKEMERIVIAYEPIWAIGTGKTATTDQANEVHSFIRKLLSEIIHADVAEKTRILYGGSVKPSNAKELMGQSDIDGALVGGASLTADSFSGIILASRG
jgi:triosephosphate isomerase